MYFCTIVLFYNEVVFHHIPSADAIGQRICYMAYMAYSPIRDMGEMAVVGIGIVVGCVSFRDLVADARQTSDACLCLSV